MTQGDEDQEGTAIPMVEAWPVQSTREADEGDQLEQAMEVLGDPDEDYAPDPL